MRFVRRSGKSRGGRGGVGRCKIDIGIGLEAVAITGKFLGKSYT